MFYRPPLAQKSFLGAVKINIQRRFEKLSICSVGHLTIPRKAFLGSVPFGYPPLKMVEKLPNNLFLGAVVV
jgi:hypothetical protein